MSINKIDSNVTGLRFAEEQTLKTLPGSPIWYPLEPNSYTDFGGKLKTVARSPISQTRQRLKGVVTDLDASGGFNQDMTHDNTLRLLQGFFFAAIREKATNIPMNGAAVPCTSVTASDHKYNFGADPGAFLAGDLIFASGFTVSSNNGLKVCASTDANDVTLAAGLTDETPAATAKLQTVGHQFGSGTSSISLNGNLVRLNDSATDFTTLGLIAGEWVFIGGDASGTHFVTSGKNIGWGRISAIVAGHVEFDKVNFVAQAETGTGLTIQIFYGSVIRNESDPNLITRRTIQLERTLGNDADGVMSEYLVGAVANQLTLNIPQADKMTVDLAFVSLDNEQYSGAEGVKAGSRPAIVLGDAYNTSSDFARIKLAVADATNASITPLFAYATDIKLTINNNVTPNKAIGTLGGFDTTAGNFEVGGSMEVYFADIAAVKAVRNNSDITMDIIITKANKGMIFDIPLLSLGGGVLKIEANQPIKLPIENTAAQSTYGNTLLFNSFDYLPDQAN